MARTREAILFKKPSAKKKSGGRWEVGERPRREAIRAAENANLREQNARLTRENLEMAIENEILKSEDEKLKVELGKEIAAHQDTRSALAEQQESHQDVRLQLANEKTASKRGKKAIADLFKN